MTRAEDDKTDMLVNVMYTTFEKGLHCAKHNLSTFAVDRLTPTQVGLKILSFQSCSLL
jgi:hypothetical protein